MIEHIPAIVENAFLYLHSADTNSDEIKPFIPKIVQDLPNTYIWAGDGPISGSPLVNDGTFYGYAEKRYWFMFPMKDASTEKSFHENSSATGASLLSSGAFLNSFIDQVKDRFKLPAGRIVLSGFQHGSCLALASSMMRKKDPFRKTILFEPYILEAYYLQNEFIQKDTSVVCIENHHMRNRVRDWLHISTPEELTKYGLNISSIVIEEGEEKLDMPMINEAVKIVRRL